MRKLFVVLFFLPLLSVAQKKQITLEDIYKKGTFRGEVAPGFGSTDISTIFNPSDVKDENGKTIALDDHLLSADQKKVLVFSGREYIYRRSSKAIVYLYDVHTKKAIKLDTSKLLHATFSPDGRRITYVKDNNLYLYDISMNSYIPVTTDGRWNYIINGNCDWVYEEEFEFTRAYEWSPNGNYIAYYRFDETNVKEYAITLYDDAYSKESRYKYPKTGEANSKVEIHIYDIAAGKDVKAQYDTGDIYIPRIKWARHDNSLVVFWMNRYQNHLKLLLTNANTGASNLLYEEKNKYFVEINDDWWFLNDRKNFLFSSEMNGFRHLYLYSMDGKTKTQLSKGNYEITEVNGVDEVNKRVYYTAAYPRPMDRNLFVTDFTGKKSIQLTEGEAWHSVELKSDFTQFYDYRSDINTPITVTLNAIVSDRKKEQAVKLVRTVSDNAKLKEKMNEYGFGKAEFIKVPNSKGDTLNGWMLKPAGFDASKKYPAVFCNYGGPGSQEAANKLHKYYLWYQLLAQKGFIVVMVDNTGTGFRGEEFKKKTYLQLGKYEMEDQMDAARYIGNMPFVDKNKIGHWGWSYGGFMSALAITKGADVFSAAVAVSPVTSWRYYDNIYTERYMRTPQENPKGYDENSPINFTHKIKGKFLIIHGTGDDNVHFQNSVQMVKSMIKNNIAFESAYYPDKNHSISGYADNTSIHIWSRMTSWILANLGNENTEKPAQSGKEAKGF